jgi:DNA replication protein DnaC
MVALSFFYALAAHAARPSQVVCCTRSLPKATPIPVPRRILKNVAQHALSRGYTVRFATASDMLAELAAQDSSSILARRLRRYTSPQLLCVDEVGYLSYNSRYADLLFEVVTRRYDAGKPILLSTDKAFSEWSEVFPHAACVVTLVDGLIHRAEIIDIEADSYRLKEAKELTAARTKRRTKKPPPS